MSEEIKVLTDHVHMRLRSEVYLGSRSIKELETPIIIDNKIVLKKIKYVPAMLTCFREAFDNSLDELSFVGKGNIDITYDEAHSYFLISDNGRGIPLSYNEDEKEYSCTIAVSQARSGRNFDQRKQVAGQNGLGISIVNSVSSNFTLFVKRDNKKFSQQFTSTEKELVKEEPNIRELKSNNTGTVISFTLDPRVFPKLVLPTELIYSLVYMVAATNLNIKFTFNGEKIKVDKKIEMSLFGEKKMIRFDLRDGDTSAIFLLKNNLSQNQFSLVNNIPTYDGGSHVKEFEKSFVKNLSDALSRESKKRKLKISRSDVLGKLFIFSSLKMDAPTFDSQSKTRLTNDEISVTIGKKLNEYNWVKFIKQNRDFIEEVFRACEIRTGKLDQSSLDKDGKKLARKRVPKLIDATSKDRSKCKLVLFEGESAKSTFSSVRNTRYHGALPLKGKVMNTWDKETKKVIASEALAQICASMGLIPGKPVDFDALRYREVIIATDADVDGSNIYCLLCAFFYKYWPELFTKEDCRVKLLKTPLIILKEKGSKNQFYIYDDINFNMDNYPNYKFVARAKGLGSLQRQEFLDHSIDDDRNLVDIYDDGNLKDTFELLFGEDTDVRKLFMEVSVDETIENFEGLKNENI